MKELLKEFAKFVFDLAKITFAVAIITPFVTEGSFSVYAVLVAIILAIIGSVIFYKGAKNESIRHRGNICLIYCYNRLACCHLLRQN